jgi:adenylyl-sulfate kinase
MYYQMQTMAAAGPIAGQRFGERTLKPTESIMSAHKHLTAVPHRVANAARQQRFGHAGAVIWLTGLSAAGKSTLAMGLEERLLALGYACYTLDGDNVRHGLNVNLGFSPEDRAENIRRVGEVAALFAHAGLICITAFISPYRADRARARQAAQRMAFHEIHVATSLAVCESRDPKGLYQKARAGELHDFTGIDAPYEAPEIPDLLIDTSQASVEYSLDCLVAYVTRSVPLAKMPSSFAGAISVPR